MHEITGIYKAALASVRGEVKPAKTDWRGSPYEDITLIKSIDTRGEVGEEMIVKMLREAGRDVKYKKAATHQKKDWDFKCGGFKYEVKTATLGARGGFQHEDIYKERHFDGIILVDIAPHAVYITCRAKDDMDWSGAAQMHRRSTGAWKWDTSLTAPGRKTKNLRCVRENKVTNVAEFLAMFDAMEARIKALALDEDEL